MHISCTSANIWSHLSRECLTWYYVTHNLIYLKLYFRKLCNYILLDDIYKIFISYLYIFFITHCLHLYINFFLIEHFLSLFCSYRICRTCGTCFSFRKILIGFPKAWNFKFIRISDVIRREVRALHSVQIYSVAPSQGNGCLYCRFYEGACFRSTVLVKMSCRSISAMRVLFFPFRTYGSLMSDIVTIRAGTTRR